MFFATVMLAAENAHSVTVSRMKRVEDLHLKTQTPGSMTLARPALAKAGLRRRSVTRRAATTDRSSTSVCPGYSRTSRSRAATDAIRAFCATWAAPICSFSMTGAWSRSMPPPGTISWKSSRNATDAAPR
jgi:hypothetical protein